MQRSLSGSLFSWCTAAVLAAPLALAIAGCASVDSTPFGKTAHGDDLAGFVSTGPPTGNDASAAPVVDGGQILTTCDLHKLRVNELSPGGAGGATDEFIELYNPCAAAVSLGGGKLAYRAAAATADTNTLYAFTTQSVPAHGYFVIANAGFTGTADLKPYQAGSGLAAAGGGVALKDATDVVIDSVGWGTASNAFVEGHPVAAPPTSQSVARTSDGVDTDQNSIDFQLVAPTPGAAN